MEKFLAQISAQDCGNKNILHLPIAKTQLMISGGETKILVSDFIQKAVSRSHLATNHIVPKSSGYAEEKMHFRSLRQVLAQHPSPLAQGPVLLPKDCEIAEVLTPGQNSKAKVISDRTQFYHFEDCKEWIPSRVGISAWRTTCDSGDADHGYEVCDLNYRVQGPASMRVDMGIVYTCVLLQCIIHCPCSICNDKRENCKMQCKSEVCEPVFQTSNEVTENIPSS